MLHITTDVAVVKSSHKGRNEFCGLFNIMALVYDGVIKVRLRDDSKAIGAELGEPDERVSQLSVMGYHNTYIEIPINLVGKYRDVRVE